MHIHLVIEPATSINHNLTFCLPRLVSDTTSVSERPHSLLKPYSRSFSQVQDLCAGPVSDQPVYCSASHLQVPCRQILFTRLTFPLPPLFQVQDPHLQPRADFFTGHDPSGPCGGQQLLLCDHPGHAPVSQLSKYCDVLHTPHTPHTQTPFLVLIRGCHDHLPCMCLVQTQKLDGHTHTRHGIQIPCCTAYHCVNLVCQFKRV